MTQTPTKTNDPDTLQLRSGDLDVDYMIDEAKRIIRVSCSSETPVSRRHWDGEIFIETLGHNPDEVNLTRAEGGGMPVLYCHEARDPKSRLGVVKRAWLENGRVMADLQISGRDEVAGIWQDIKDGVLTNISAGYKSIERQLVKENKNAPDDYRITSWTLHEVSVVGIPADATVGMGRCDESDTRTERGVNNDDNPTPTKDITMPDNTEIVAEDETAAIQTRALDAATPVVDNSAEIQKRAADELQTRNDEINFAFDQFDGQHEDLRTRALSDMTVTLDGARQMILDAKAKNVTPAGGETRVIGDERKNFINSIESTLCHRSGIGDENDSNQMGYSLTEMTRRLLEFDGVDTRNLNHMDLVGRAFTHSSGDFPLLLSNIANKALLKGFDEAPESFEAFTSVGTLADFKTSKRNGLGSIDSLRTVGENGEFKQTTVGEYGEEISLQTVGEIFSISRQAIINDDLGAFTKLPQLFGAAARRTVGDAVYAVLTGNPTMADGTALFHADHNNLLTGAGSVFGTAGLSAAKVAMRKQKLGNKGKALNIAVANVIVPVALEETALQLLGSEADVTTSNSKVNNVHRGSFNVISDARLDDDSDVKWYTTAAPGIRDVIEVAYLNGVQTPFIEQQQGFTVDGVQLKVRHDFGVKALDSLSINKSNGSA